MKKIYAVCAMLLCFAAGCASQTVAKAENENEVDTEQAIQDYVERNKSEIAQNYLEEHYVEEDYTENWLYQRGYEDGYFDALSDYGIEP